MVRKFAIVALGALVVGCGTTQQSGSIAASASAQAQTKKSSQLIAESYGLISRWLLDRNYQVTSVSEFKQGRVAAKVAVRGVFWATYRTKKGFLFRSGYWNLSLRDEMDAGGIGGGGYGGRGGYDRSYGPSYTHYSGASMYDFFEGVEEEPSDEGLFDDYDYNYTGDCEEYGGNRRRRNPRRDYDDGLDCYPGNDYDQPGYGGQPGYGNPGTPYRSPYNSYNGTQVPLVRIPDNSRSHNFKVFNGEPAIAFVDGQRIKEVRLVRDGSAIWKTAF